MYDLRPGDPEQIGEFRVVGRLGGGGMGTVYLGESSNGLQVAIKVVHEYLASDPEFRRRFGHEVEAASRISGTYTAEVLTADPDARLPWMATEFVPGRNLLQTVEADGPLAPEAVLDLAAGVADALTEIHRAGVIHRDLKPSNILLSPRGPRVIDFGIARAAEASTVTSTGKITGSAAYMSPEQAVGTKGVGPATDIFSLGALLYYAATGEPAFGTGPATAMLYRTVHAAVDMSPITSAPLRDLIDACLEKAPEDRPNAKHVAMAARSGQPVIRLPRSGTPPTGVTTGATALTTGGLSAAAYAGGPSAYDALMDQVAIATASRGNPIIQPQALSTGKVPTARRRSPSAVQAAAGAALLVALIVGGVVMLTQKGKPEAPTANISGSNNPSPSATGAAAVADPSKIKAGGVGSPSSVPSTGRRVTLDNGTVIIPGNDGTAVTISPSRTTGPKPTTTKSPTAGTTSKPGAPTTKPSTTGGGGGGGGTTDPGDPTTDPDDPTTDPGTTTTGPDSPTTDPGTTTTGPDSPTTTTDTGVIP